MTCINVINPSYPQGQTIEVSIDGEGSHFHFFIHQKLKEILIKGRLSYHLCVQCFSQVSFDSEVYTKSAAVADFVYTSESNESCEKHLTLR